MTLVLSRNYSSLIHGRSSSLYCETKDADSDEHSADACSAGSVYALLYGTWGRVVSPCVGIVLSCLLMTKVVYGQILQ